MVSVCVCAGVVLGMCVCPHIPHLMNGSSCTYVHSGHVLLLGRGGDGGGGRGVSMPSPPTSIRQDPADVDGGGEGGETRRGGEALLKRRFGLLK